MQNAIPPGDPRRIAIIGREQGFKGLAVHYTTVFDTGIQQECPALQTAWTPTPADLTALANGANIMVQLLASQHPPIAVYVGEPSDDATMPMMTYDQELIMKCVRAAEAHSKLTTKKGRAREIEIMAVILEAAGFKTG